MRTWISFHSRRKCPPDSIGKSCWTTTLWKPACASPLLLFLLDPHKMFWGWSEGLLSLHKTAPVPCAAQVFLLSCPQHPSNIKPSALSNPTEKTRQPQGTWSGQPGGGEVTKSICSISLWLTVHPPSFLFSSSFTPSTAHTRVRLLG